MDRPASKAAGLGESKHNGTSTTSMIVSTARRIRAGSSPTDTPALTSSTCAPAATCARASERTREKSPAAISSASFLRPVGLIRSPIITKGRSGLMITVLLLDERIVSIEIAPKIFLQKIIQFTTGYFDINASLPAGVFCNYFGYANSAG